MHREEDYCDYQTSMLLKKKGYNEPCETSYGTAVMHNGEGIDEDDEWSLKVNGRANEIEYVPGGIIHYFYNTNEKMGRNSCSRPHIYDVLKWLREVHKIDICICTGLNSEGKKFYNATIYRIDEENKCVNCIAEFVHGKSIIDGTDTYEQICSEAILFCLKKKKLLNK